MNTLIQNHLNSSVQIMNAYEENRKLRAKNDGIVNDLYHILEFVKLDAVQMSKVAKQLRQALQTRRKLKEDSILFQSILDTTTSKIKPDELIQRQNNRISKYIEESHASFKSIFPS